MANTIALAVNYLADPSNLNAVYKASSKTADLEASRVQFIGADTVKLPKISFGAALGTYDRALGFTAMDVTKSWDTYQLSQDKGNQILVDVMDDEESKGQGVIQFANEYIRRVVVPAVDTYRFANLVTGAGNGIALSVPTAATILEDVLASFEALAEDEVENVEGLILYMTPAIETLLMTSTDIQKFVGMGDWNGNIDTKVKMFNQAKIVIVPTARLGANVNFMLVDPSAVLSVVKHNPAYFFAAGTHTGIDGDIINYRLYYDLFVIAERANGIYKSIAV